MLSYLSSIPISVLRCLDTAANKFFDRSNRLYDAALLTMCYTQHVLRHVIDSKINHVRHFIKIPFMNKRMMDFIDLPSTFKDKSVQSAVQIISKIVKYQSFVINIITLSGALYLISIKLFLILISKRVPLAPETVRTLNMFIRLRVMLLRAILKSLRIRSIIAEGPKYRLPAKINFQKCRENIAASLNEYYNQLCKREHGEFDALKDWKLNIFKIIDRRFSVYSQNMNMLPRNLR